MERPTSPEPENLPRNIAVVIPALNEEEALPLVLAELQDALGAFAKANSVGSIRILVVDNGSTDGTSNAALEGGAEIVFEPRKGYGQACLAGLEVLFAGSDPMEDSGLVLFLDADHSDYPADLIGVLEPIVKGEADFVIGSRVLGGASMEALLPQAWFGNRLCCFLMWLLFGVRHTDLGPFRALEARALKHLKMADTNFGWTIEMQLKAAAANLRVVEVPVRYRARIGTSKITGTIRGTVGAGTKILSWIFGWRVKSWFTRGGIPKYR
ncbi:MAG: glycosyltransferase involved in cell wall biosynthesis [Gammaproteobacteria bacterium]|jgi:glycosyltransferase involved in cell wall biosynthesis